MKKIICFSERQFKHKKNNIKQCELSNKVLKNEGIFKPIGKMYVLLTLSGDDLA